MSSVSLTLQQYIDRIWFAISRDPDANFASNDQLTRLINEGRREVWNALLDIDENFGVAPEFSITTVQGTTRYDLPDNFRAIIGVRQQNTDIDIPLTLNKRLVERADVRDALSPLNSYALYGKQLKVLASADGVVIVDYLQSIDMYQYVDEVVDGEGNITTYGKTSVDPNIPVYGEYAVVAYSCKQLMIRENTRSMITTWDDILKDQIEEVIRHGQRHLSPTVIRSSNNFGNYDFGLGSGGS